MKIKKDEVKRILFITLTNIGDIVLTTPLLSALDREFPEARIDVMVGPLGKDIFLQHPRVFKVIIYNKHLPVNQKRRLTQKLRNMKYDLVVDLKNSLIPMLIGPKYRTSPIQASTKGTVHKKDFHLMKLKTLGLKVGDEPFSIHIWNKDAEYIDSLVDRMPNKEKLIVISPTAKSLIKRWKDSGFAEVADRLAKEFEAPVIMVGDTDDRSLIDSIIGRMEAKPVNMAGLTTIPQLARLLKRARLVITNDSAPMHLAHAVGTDVLAIFGPTDPRKYGPRGKKDRVIRKELKCSPCEVAQCKFKHECMDTIMSDEVYKAAKEMLKN